MSADKTERNPAVTAASLAAEVAVSALRWKARLAIVAVLIGLLALCLACAVLSSIFQKSTAVWPVPLSVDQVGNYTATGWRVSSGFGWRQHPDTVLAEQGILDFHEGIDLAGPTFCLRCPIPAMFDAEVEYVGWDPGVLRSAADPLHEGGGQTVMLRNGPRDANGWLESQHETFYAHLEPYRLYIQLQGRIEDPWAKQRWDGTDYSAYAAYQPIGHAELLPDWDGKFAVECLELTARGPQSPDALPFDLTKEGPGTWSLVYDRPLKCKAIVYWPTRRQPGWQGWIPDDGAPFGLDSGRQGVYHEFETQIDRGYRASDVALRFRAHLVPPPPPPPPTATPWPATPIPWPTWPAQPDRHSLSRPAASGTAPAPTTGLPQSCEVLGDGAVRCVWALAEVPTRAEREAQARWKPAAAGAAEQHADNPAPELSSRTGAQGTAQAWIAPRGPQYAGSEGQATWTVSLGGNTRGFWHIGFSGSAGASYDSALDLQVTLPDGAPLACQTSSDAHGKFTWCPQVHGSETGLAVTVRLDGNWSSHSDAAINLYINDVDSGGSGYAVGQFPLTIIAGTPPSPSATPWPTSSPTPAPTETPGSGPDCRRYPLVYFNDIRVSSPRLIQPAANSFRLIRQEIKQRTGVDYLATLGDMYRSPGYRSGQEGQGVAYKSWHKAGRAVDLNLGDSRFMIVPEGAYYRVYVKTAGGQRLDLTAIFLQYGWKRIPRQGSGPKQLEWWHFEYHPDNISWESAMLQGHDIQVLRAAFPDVDWNSVGCSQGSGPMPPEVEEWGGQCQAQPPTFSGEVEYLQGCGPPVMRYFKVNQLEHVLGFVGMSGLTTGPHLHLGMKIRSVGNPYQYSGIRNTCEPNSQWLPSGIPTPTPNGQAQQCQSEYVDPLDFLPQAHGAPATAEGAGPPARSPVAADELYQLPPPGQELLFTPEPNDQLSGQYWSPYRDEGAYGGGGMRQWLCGLLGATCGNP